VDEYRILYKCDYDITCSSLKQLTYFDPFLLLTLQDEFLDVIYWIRQIIALILGVIWGVAPLKGFLGIAM
jgi:hypothetical protein